jgi:hypothetical protein
MKLKSLVVVTLLVFGRSAAFAQAAQTKSITIGSFKYIGTFIQAFGSPVSAYQLDLGTTNVTKADITFSNVILYVKGGSSSTKQGGFQVITTGLGCGNPPFQTPCSLLWLGGKGFSLPACARFDTATQELIQNCISIAVQFVSLTKANVSLFLADGSSFCMYGINNIFLKAGPDQTALDPKCTANGFCKGASVPIILREAPAKSCNQ